MFKLHFILNPEFREQGFLISRAKYETMAYTSAILLVQALKPCSDDFTVHYGDKKYTPVLWEEYVRRVSLTDDIVQRELNFK
jgi:hypothetical protein